VKERKAFLLERVQAITIDTSLIIFVMYTFSILFECFGHVPDWMRMWLFLILFVFYEPICTAFGTTLGNYVIKIRVRRISNPEKRINIIRAFLRYFFKTIFGWFSFITIFTSKNNRAIHDYIGGSVMIKV
jgi:uncharacterized RDD family membrane protein YckC